MATTTRHDFRLIFNTDRSEMQRLMIARADHNATATQIEAAMLAMIASGVIYHRSGNPVSVAGAQLITTVRTARDVSA